MKKQPIRKVPTVLERVVQALRVEVRGAKRAGEKLECIASLAEQLRVSTNTVRSALTMLQQEGLVELRHGSGTYVRQAGKLAKHVALVAEIDLIHPVTSVFFKEMFRLLRSMLLEAGHDARVYSGVAIPGLGEPLYSEVAGRHVVADIDRVSAAAAFLMLPDEPWIAPLQARSIPIVSNVSGIGASVNSDRDGMVRQAVAALAASGCRKAGFICWGNLRGVSQAPRGDGALQRIFSDTAKDWGLAVRPEWMFETGNPSEPGAGWEAFRDIWRRSIERPDGLVIADDQLLPGIFESLAESETPLANQPVLATHFTEGNPVQIPGPLIKLLYSPEEHARAMADLVLESLSGADIGHRQVAVPHRLVLPEERVNNHIQNGARGTARPTQSLTPVWVGRSVPRPPR